MNDPMQTYREMVMEALRMQQGGQDQQQAAQPEGFWGKTWHNFKQDLPATMAGVGAALAHPSKYNGGALGSMGVGMLTQAQFKMKLDEMRQHESSLRYQQQQQTLRSLMTGRPASEAMKEGFAQQRGLALGQAALDDPRRKEWAPYLGAGMDPGDAKGFQRGETQMDLDKARAEEARAKATSGGDPGGFKGRKEDRDIERDQRSIQDKVIAYAYKDFASKYGRKFGLNLNISSLDDTNIAQMLEDPGSPLGGTAKGFEDYWHSEEGQKAVNTARAMYDPRFTPPPTPPPPDKAEQVNKLIELFAPPPVAGVPTPQRTATPDTRGTTAATPPPTPTYATTPAPGRASADDLVRLFAQ